MIVEYVVGRFLHEIIVIRHNIPEQPFVFSENEKELTEQVEDKTSKLKISERSTLRKSKYI